MVHAFVFVKSDVGQSAGLSTEMRTFDGVREANVVAGDWDLVVEIEGDEVYDILNTTIAEIQALEGIVDTKTYVALEE